MVFSNKQSLYFLKIILKNQNIDHLNQYSAIFMYFLFFLNFLHYLKFNSYSLKILLEVKLIYFLFLLNLSFFIQFTFTILVNNDFQ